jgi:predicted aspartyl protease
METWMEQEVAMIVKEATMKSREINGMGRVVVPFVVSNYRDVLLAEEGHLDPDQVRSVELDAVVDTAANYLVLPSHTVALLGLPETGKVSVRYADRRSGRRRFVDQAQVELLGRKGIFPAIVEPNRGTALIGAIVLETLDLLVDCSQQRLVPRDPKGIIAEIE